MKRPDLKRWLLRRADSPRQNLNLLLGGFTLFSAGAAVLLLAEYLIGDSWQRELLALGGLILAGAGSILAAVGYLCLSLLRLFRFFNDDRHHD
ncbi:hypothetical protein GCM10011348_38560 [Marinobacterium nitratireducens]|uniref:Uncharacterized protein n=1 Tax=Marinobacterium nitratireducens TaxID=518897 RepID=A0A917ZPS9_9GAMM|nr:hypothetical protein [Marinobacterium nitratireducens]GGO86809.1 hypothetical protein GCM10011348_38560 [Marinobacterium nitratireducens]